MTKDLIKCNYKKQSYILSNAYYGSAESQKKERAMKELGVVVDGRMTVPEQVLFDQKGKVLYFHRGGLNNKDTIMYYLNNYNK